MGTYAKALKRLVPDEFKRIEEGHHRLQNSIDHIRSTCGNLDNQNSCHICTREQISTCQGRLVSFIHNILNVCSDHFDYEESLLRRVARITEKDNDFHDHQRAHLNNLNELNVAIMECASSAAQSDTAECYRQLHRKTSKLYVQHDRLFDDTKWRVWGARRFGSSSFEIPDARI